MRRIEVRIFEFGKPQFDTKTYHSDISFDHADHVAFYYGGVQPQKVWGDVVHTIVKEVYMGKGEFDQKVREIIDEWDNKEYSVTHCNCNHFTDSCLKAFGFDGLPGGYFSRGDHLDKQLWNYIAQGGLGLSAEQADKAGAAWCRVRDDVGKAVKSVFAFKF